MAAVADIARLDDEGKSPSRRKISAPTVWNALSVQFRVIYALMMHDIKSRFFGNGLGYIVTILWPSAHIAIVIGIFWFTGKHAPYGNDRLLYVSIGVLPYIIWNYISRFTMLGTVMNRNFLQYPIVKSLDLMAARQCLELVTCTIITILLAVFLICCGSDVMPSRPAEAAEALLSAALLGVGFGILGGVICMIVPFFQVVYVLVLIVSWISCGLAFDPETMPEAIGNVIAWNPLMHSVEWMRLAYYDDFPAHLLDKQYVIAVGAGALAIGLVLDRLLKQFMI